MDSAFAVEGGSADGVFKEEFTSVLAVLDLLKNLLHRLLRIFGDDSRAAGVIAVFSVVGNAVTHVGEAALIEEVDDELHFVHAFEISHFGLVARFDEGFKTGLNEVGDAAAEDRLFTEEVGFGLFFEGGLDDAAAGAADTLSVSKPDSLFAFAATIVKSDQAGDAAAFDEFGTNEVPGALRSDHDRAVPFRKIEEAVVDVEPVRGQNDSVGLEVRTDIFGKDLGLDFVREAENDDVGLLDRFDQGDRLEAVFASELVVGGTFALADNDVKAAVAEVLSVSVTLRTITEDGDRLAF